MRKASRKAEKLECRVQVLTSIKVTGTADERMFARKKLADGLSGRYQHKQRGLSMVKGTVKVPAHKKADMRPSQGTTVCFVL